MIEERFIIGKWKLIDIVLIQRKTKLDGELKKELDKCAVACANCHRQINAGLILLGDKILNIT